MAAILHAGDRVGLVACSNPLARSEEASITALQQILRGMGLDPVLSPCIYAGDSFFTGPQRAAALEAFYLDPDIRAIFDLSGGDLANETLETLHLSLAAENPKPFFGYSDLTTILNALFVQTGQESWLYQIRWLADSCAAQQQQRFAAALLQGREEELTACRWTFLRGTAMEGVLVGGNIRCFLKLAGTPWFPDLRGKLLFLESRGGTPALVLSQLYQLRQLGAFEQAAGILLGTFVNMEDSGAKPTAPELLLQALGSAALPVAATPDVGHRPDSRALIIGRMLHLERES